MKITKAPGFSLRLIGLVLMFLVRPVIGGVPVIGGMLYGIAFIVGALGLLGGGYLMMRSFTGAGR